VFGRPLIAATLHENVYGIPILINCTPEILPLPLNGNEHFIDVPPVAQPPWPLFELASVVRPKLLAPLANCFIGDRDAALGEQLFHFTEAEAEPMLEPNGMADDFGWKAVTMVDGWFSLHRPSLPKAR